jgi:FkbM family methyltransferase
MKRLLKRILSFGPLSRFPVRVRQGLAKGAWWSLYPATVYWRQGGGHPAIDKILLQHACQLGSVAWDLGAHLGLYTVGIARHVGEDGQVVAFEPDAVSRRRLELHVARNGLKNVLVIGAAAGSATGEGVLLQDETFGGTSPHLAFSERNTAAIPWVALDDLVAGNKIPLPQFIKIDVGGHGGRALDGMRRSLTRSRPVLLMTFHGGDENRQAASLLQSLNYGCHELDGVPCPWPTREYHGDLLLMPKKE